MNLLFSLLLYVSRLLKLLKVKEPMSGNFIVSTLDKYIKTTVTKTVNGVSKTYYRYTYDVDTNGYRGEVTLKIKF